VYPSAHAWAARLGRARAQYHSCNLCEHRCRVNRAAGEVGRCKAGPTARVFRHRVSVGYILVIEEFIRMVWGVNFRSINPPSPLAGTTELFGSTVTDYRLFIIGFGLLLSLALFFVVERTRIGIVVRAASANSAMVSCLGIDVGKVRTGVFVAGAMLAAISGVVAAPLLPLKLGMSFTIIIDCFIVVVIGGLGNIRGAILGAMLIGMMRAVGQQFAADWIFLLTYGLLIATLIFRPEGLFNVRGRTA